MSLSVTVVKADLPQEGGYRKVDSFCELKFQGRKKKTEIKKEVENYNPHWGEDLVFNLSGVALSPTDELKVKLFDWERIGRNKLIGECYVPLRDLLGSNNNKEINAKMMKRKSSQPVSGPMFEGLTMQRPSTHVSMCTVNLQLAYNPPKERRSSVNASGPKAASGSKIDIEESEEFDNVMDEKEEEPSPVKSKRKSMASKQRVYSSKVQDFQIRVKIIEGRQFIGNNIKPVCRVKCHNKVRQTRIKDSTNCPHWNETFFFNFVISPAELLVEPLLFEVFSSRRLRSDSLIGSFQCDLSMIYEQGGHAILHKWLLLSDPDDASCSVRGYLKVCTVILEAGVEAPSFKCISDDTDLDIDDNLLRPPGAILHPGTLKVKVYRAEDIPRMDADFINCIKSAIGLDEGEKDYVDPYAVVQFAGKSARTKILYATDHPEWNQVLNIKIKFPSVCEKIKLQVMDWDRINRDDVCGSTFLSVPDISKSGDFGFLPMFGPCYVNLYGSTREYSCLPNEYEDLNLGKGEGCAYRGRILMEIRTDHGEPEETDPENISRDEIMRVQKYLRRRKYKLLAAFLDASMVCETDGLIEYEVSIGNYGNKLDENVPPSSSTTQPTNAVYDGSHFYFLPWEESKPCVVVDCSWEDISFRLEALNLLQAITDRLEWNIEMIKMGLNAYLDKHDLSQMVVLLLQQLIIDCTEKVLPNPTPGQHIETDLDIQLRSYRIAELHKLAEEAQNLLDSANDVEEALSNINGLVINLKSISVEPQNSVPDVIIWMISGDKRIAYCRIPANEVMYSECEDYCGRMCGKTQSLALKYPGNMAAKDGLYEFPTLLRIKVWLGLEKHERHWYQKQSEGKIAIFAETYENQVSVLGSWINKGLTMTRPKWSDVTGRIKLPRDNLTPPSGWKWDSEWYVSPEPSLLFENDAGHELFLEDIFEFQARLPATHWGSLSESWMNANGETVPPKDEIQLPEGWNWCDDWQVDTNRAVDENGWEYCVEHTMGGYGPVEKNYHMCRQRRWVRQRELKVKQKQILARRKTELSLSEGWEYAPLFNMKFHMKEHTLDFVRRRRWHRRMVAKQRGSFSSSAMELFSPLSSNYRLYEFSEETKHKTALTTPRMILTLKKNFKYQLRAYMYQARDLLAGDRDGLSDPFARVSFLNVSGTTKSVDKSLCPTWDQTLIFDEIEIPGSVADGVPPVVVELFDYDCIGYNDFIGRTQVEPLVKPSPKDSRTPALQWYRLKKEGMHGGELLASFELLLLTGEDLPFLPPKNKDDTYIVPSGIRPIVQRTGIEVLAWGVRNMKRFQLMECNSPSVEFEISGTVIKTSTIKDTKNNPNFDVCSYFFDVMLPKEGLYMPTMNIRVRDHRQFGRKPLVGIHTIKDLKQYQIVPGTKKDDSTINVNAPINDEHVIDMPGTKNSQPGDTASGKKGPFYDEEIDWWSKYYASLGDLAKSRKYKEKGYLPLKVFSTALEDQAQYNKFKDFCQAFELRRGKNINDEELLVAGEFKGSFRMYPLPADPSDPLPPKVFERLPLSTPEECVVRVYVVCAEELQPKDNNGLADPYLIVKLGKTKLSSREEYIPNHLNPLFGKMFELTAIMPIHKDLVIRVMDYDLLNADDIIGETVLDLENRYLTKFRATCGLPAQYHISGPNIWRNSRQPTEILNEYCIKNWMGKPKYLQNNMCKVGGKVYKLSEFEPDLMNNPHMGVPEERLALYVLNTFPLVPEHIETRPLYNPLQPSIEQGKLQMWVDIFPKSQGPPGPVCNIAPRKPKEYELRVIIWNTKDVILDETTIHGDRMSDIYVKCWISGVDEKQRTDVHYRSFDGEGNFNWRMKFPFHYIPAEQEIVVIKKEHQWSLDTTEQRLPPNFTCQVWDNDKFSPDDFLGTVELNLSDMPQPSKNSKKCSLSQLSNDSESQGKVISLFEQKRAKGFWPVHRNGKGTKELTGKVEMEIEVLTKDEAEKNPAGLGQDEPNTNPHLDPPQRPATSFLWFTSPWKTFKHIIWRHYKCCMILSVFVFMCVLVMIVFVYTLPSAVVNKLIGKL